MSLDAWETHRAAGREWTLLGDRDRARFVVEQRPEGLDREHDALDGDRAGHVRGAVAERAALDGDRERAAGAGDGLRLGRVAAYGQVAVAGERQIEAKRHHAVR